MKKRRFISTLAALALTPWSLLIGRISKRLVRVFPQNDGHHYIGIEGLVIRDPRCDDLWVVGDEKPYLFEWNGHLLNNNRGNLYSGYKFGDKQMLEVADSEQ